MMLFLLDLLLLFLLLLLETSLDCDLALDVLSARRFFADPEVALLVARPSLLLAALQVVALASRIFSVAIGRRAFDILFAIIVILDAANR